MTDKPTFHPKPGRIDLPVAQAALPKSAPHRGGFDPALLGHRGPTGPKGPKGRPMQLPRKSGSR